MDSQKKADICESHKRAAQKLKEARKEKDKDKISSIKHFLSYIECLMDYHDLLPRKKKRISQ